MILLIQYNIHGPLFTCDQNYWGCSYYLTWVKLLKMHGDLNLTKKKNLSKDFHISKNKKWQVLVSTSVIINTLCSGPCKKYF